jgi:hypothetical protein
VVELTCLSQDGIEGCDVTDRGEMSRLQFGFTWRSRKLDLH